MTPFSFFILAMASFRLTHLLVNDTITEFVRKPFHEEIIETDEHGNQDTYIIVKGQGFHKFIGELLTCHWCTGIWCSAILLIINEIWFLYPIILLLALAGCAAVVETIISKLQ